MILETNRIIIRQFSMHDIENVFALVSDEDVMRYIGPPMTREQVPPILQNVMKSYENPGYGWWAMILKESELFVGSMGLVAREIGEQKETELCFQLAKTHWGKGLTTEAATACRDFAFHALNLNRLIAIMDPQNKAAHRVVSKVGMAFEKETDWQGEPVVIYAIQNNGG